MPRSVELFLGGLSRDTRRADLEDIFSRYGRITRCDIKYVNGYAGTAYGFIGYEDDRDAEDAIKHENGRKICGQAVVIERSKSKAWNKSSKVSSRRDDRSSRRSRSRSRSRDRRRRHRSRTRSRSRSRSRTRSPRRNRSRRDRSRSRSKSRLSRTRSRSPRSPKQQQQQRDNNVKENGDSKRSRSRSRSVENSQPQIREASPLKNQTDNNNKDFENDLHEGNSANGISINEITNIVEQAVKSAENQELSKEEEVKPRSINGKDNDDSKPLDHNNNESNQTDA